MGRNQQRSAATSIGSEHAWPRANQLVKINAAAGLNER